MNKKFVYISFKYNYAKAPNFGIVIFERKYYDFTKL